jgi:hypothetical protein
MTEINERDIETTEEFTDFADELSDEALDRTDTPKLCTSWMSRQ